MRIAIILNDEQYFYPRALQDFFCATKHLDSIAAVYVLPSSVKKSKTLRYNFKSALIMGLPFVIRYAFALIFQKVSIADVCRAHRVSCKHFSSINSQAFLKELVKSKIEIGINACSQIYGKRILGTSIKFYNLHPSILPQHKGQYPLFWALADGGEKFGVSCHEINSGIDAGTILWQKKMSAKRPLSVRKLVEQYAAEIPVHLEHTIDVLKGTSAPSTVSEHPPDTYGPEPSLKQIWKSKWRGY